MNSTRAGGWVDGPAVLVHPHGLTVVVGRRFVQRVLLPLGLVLALVSVLVNAVVLSGRVGADLAEFLLYRFSVDRELTLPTLFQGALLLACAASAWTIRGALPPSVRRQRRGWALVTLAFVYLCLDELLALHERLMIPLRESLDLTGALYYSWVVVAVPLVVLFALVLVPFLRSLPRSTVSAVVLAGALYVGGAAGMEMVGGVVSTRVGESSVPYVLATTLEEVLEMSGLAAFLAGTGTHYLRHCAPRLTAVPVADAPDVALPHPVTTACPGG